MHIPILEISSILFDVLTANLWNAGLKNKKHEKPKKKKETKVGPRRNHRATINVSKQTINESRRKKNSDFLKL